MKLGNIVSVLIDFEKVLDELKPYTNSYCNENFENFIDQILNYISEKIVNSDYSLVLIIAGVEKYKDTVPITKLKDISKKAKELENFKILFIDNSFALKKMAFETWYSELVVNSNGIWIGTGLSDQAVIKTREYNKKYSQKISNDFGWYVKNGEGSLIKLFNGDDSNEE